MYKNLTFCFRKTTSRSFLGGMQAQTQSLVFGKCGKCYHVNKVNNTGTFVHTLAREMEIIEQPSGPRFYSDVGDNRLPHE